VPKHAAAGLETVRQAILQRRKLRIEYVDGGNRPSTRTLDPLALYFWGTTWSVAAWCESREDFRIFRLDRIRNLQMGGEKFDEVPGRTLADFVQSVSRVAGG
jgi:predicted DNA-binding transcriptional regulator YafY